MTALAAGRSGSSRFGSDAIPLGISYPVADTVKCWKGGIAVINSSGFVKPGVAATGLIAAGVFYGDADNSTAVVGHANGFVSVAVEQGCWPMSMGADADALTNANIGAVVYIIDDQTVGATDGSAARSPAGVLMFVTGTGSTAQAWVQFGVFLTQATAAVAGALLLATSQTITGQKTSSGGLLASGTAAFDFSGASGIFKTSTGAVTIGAGAISITGAVSLAANIGITAVAGTGAFDLSLATGLFKTPTSTTTFFTFLQRQAMGAATNLIAAATGTAIPVTSNGSLAITQNGAETNTLAIPTYLGQILDLFVDTDTSGARVVTSAQRINQAGNTIITMTEVGDFIRLVGITIAGALRWQVVANDGAVLS